MAGMAGDVNLREKKAEEKEDHGAVELFKKAAELTDDEVAIQLYPVLFSKEAKAINAARKNRVFTVLIAFAESVLKRKAELPKTCNTVEEFRAAQAKCQHEITKLRTDLLALVSNQIITAGYILDSQLFADLTEWFERPDNLKRFGGWWRTLSDLFWVNDYGSLQSVAAPRDAHVCRMGIGSVVDNGLLPDRTLKNADGTSHFDSSSRLGLDFCLGFYGRGMRYRVTPLWLDSASSNLMSSKNRSIAKFMRCPDKPAHRKSGACLVM